MREGFSSVSSIPSPSTSCRALYKEEKHDFEKLALKFPSLLKHLVPSRGGHGGSVGRSKTIDFTKEESVEELTKCLLMNDFSVHWERPPSSLIPPVPNRFTYILWLRDLLQHSSNSSSSSDGARDIIRGVDIGTGGSLIYALLGAAAFGWSFLATENCKYSLEWAERNLANNPQLRELITIRDSGKSKTAVGGNILLGVVDESIQYDFCMCNPPFFDVNEERTLHKAGHGGLQNELQCPGGESAFIERIFRDSMRLREQIKWYSTMTGKKKTLKAMVSKLRKASSQVKEIRTTTFVCGRTTRWGVAWTFHRTQQQCSAAGSARHQVLGRKRSAPCPSLDKNLVSAILYLEAQSNRQISRKHSFMIRESSKLTAQSLKRAIAEAMRDKVMWNESSYATQTYGFKSEVEESKGNPFELLCKYSIPSNLNSPNKSLKALDSGESARGAEGDASSREHSESILKYTGKCVQFKICIFQYSKELISIQSTLFSSNLQQHTHADLVLFQALLACLEGCLKQESSASYT